MVCLSSHMASIMLARSFLSQPMRALTNSLKVACWSASVMKYSRAERVNVPSLLNISSKISGATFNARPTLRHVFLSRLSEISRFSGTSKVSHHCYHQSCDATSLYLKSQDLEKEVESNEGIILLRVSSRFILGSNLSQYRFTTQSDCQVHQFVSGLIMYMKKILHCDWLRAVQFFFKQCRKEFIQCKKR